MPHFWLRHETRQTERRAAITPEDAGRLIRDGATVTVEESPQRIFEIERYREVGCRIAPATGWFDAPEDAVVVGLKELPVLPPRLRHRHVYFGHAYKNQEGAAELLHRFRTGGGTLLDAEYLTDGSGRRLATFGYWAGYVGAALAMLRFRGRLTPPLHPYARPELDAALAPGPGERQPRVLVIGANGRCGRGARDALAVSGVDPTCWDIDETRDLDKVALLGHDILINAVFVRTPQKPFVTHVDIDADRRLSLICDVSCDVTGDCNTLPIYERVTSWPQPVVRLRGPEHPLDLIAIDNLPSLLPLAASTAFSAQLTPLLARIDRDDPVWQRAATHFRDALERSTRDA
ncbi:saccharopine dehydrogenase [Plantactinospora sp. KBS50]|uniref:saccharopine dehydrogenase n=1 Tax=Plantactinospora sp. KBS50 TaxID=2024580 RepID=UPI000BAA9817|nr:saccharopine dehydrogenase [Plantactinospora sp. KBS50]ASW55622.1 saccharopine dehydrogenase [Plantactinospora sp. KBS50]